MGTFLFLLLVLVTLVCWQWYFGAGLLKTASKTDLQRVAVHAERGE